MNALYSSARHASSHSRRGAFSLLEVAFALVIFVIGAIALLRIFPGGLDVLEDSGNRRVASQVSQNLVTSFNSGDLAPTTPYIIYDVDQSGGPTDGQWNDYPSSPFGLRRQAGTIPTNSDDFNSAKDRINHIRGEKQGIIGGSIYTNYAADGRVNILREGTVQNVAVASNGQLDFRNAVYSDSQRTDKPNLPFREPILNLYSIVDAGNVATPVNADTAVIQRTTTAQTYTITFTLDDASTTYGMASTVNLSTGGNMVGINPNGTDCTPGTETRTANAVQVQLTVPAITTPTAQLNERVILTVTPPAGVSVSRDRYEILISSDGTSAPAPSAGDLLPVRAPLGIRQGGTTAFYISYSWTPDGGTKYQGVSDQPFNLPTNDTGNAVVPYTVTSPALVVPSSNLTLKFRQPLTTANVGNDRVKLTFPPATTPPLSFADSDGTIAATQLAQVALDYNVRSWEYVSEDISQFGTPFSNNAAFVDTNTPEGLTQYEFMSGAGYAGNQAPATDVREIRTRLGNLRGSVQIKGFYGQSTQPLDVVFNVNGSVLPTGVTTTVTPAQYVRQKKLLAKEGRLYLPAVVNNLPLSHARVYYRSRDAWAQQLGVTAAHYLPYIAGTTREPWREYYRASDGFIYFHATEAGKTVECVHGTPGALQNETIEISPDVLFVSAMPSDVPATFSTATYTNPYNASDPRNGRFFLARSRDRMTDNIFDVRRPRGTNGVVVRTLWLNNDRYSQEIAQ